MTRKHGQQPHSLHSSVPNTSRALGNGAAAHLKTLQRQHKITIRRLDSIQRKLQALPPEEPEPEEDKKMGLVEWFLKLVRW